MNTSADSALQNQAVEREKGLKVGLDMSQCILDIANGKITEDEISCIITGEKGGDETWDNTIADFKEFEWEQNPERAEEIFRDLLKQGKIKEVKDVSGRLREALVFDKSKERWTDLDELGKKLEEESADRVWLTREYRTAIAKFLSNSEQTEEPTITNPKDMAARTREKLTNTETPVKTLRKFHDNNDLFDELNRLDQNEAIELIRQLMTSAIEKEPNEFLHFYVEESPRIIIWLNQRSPLSLPELEEALIAQIDEMVGENKPIYARSLLNFPRHSLLFHIAPEFRKKCEPLVVKAAKSLMKQNPVSFLKMIHRGDSSWMKGIDGYDEIEKEAVEKVVEELFSQEDKSSRIPSRLATLLNWGFGEKYPTEMRKLAEWAAQNKKELFVRFGLDAHFPDLIS